MCRRKIWTGISLCSMRRYPKEVKQIDYQAECSIAPGTIQSSCSTPERSKVGLVTREGALSRCSVLRRCCFVGIIRSSIEGGNKCPLGSYY
jgi:hypothetical protein